MGYQQQGHDFVEAADILATTIRNEAGGEAVTLVIHDWGCFWGFIVQLRYPELVKAIVAMDVGHPCTATSGWRTLPGAIIAGLAYQYWLTTAYLLARGTVGTPLRQFVPADAMVRGMVRMMMLLGEKALNVDERITADACYPYWFFQSGWGVRGINSWDGKSALPSCPCLYLYGRKKPAMFHQPAWEAHLKRREDCRVEALNAGHWLQFECQEEVNSLVEAWLDKAVAGFAAARL